MLRWIFLCLLLVGCIESNKDHIPIGLVTSLTGQQSSFGVQARKGLTLAVEKFNEKGGYRGRPIKVYYGDNRSDDEKVDEAVKELIQQHRVTAIIGDNRSARTLQAAKIAQAEGVPLITQISTQPEITKVGHYIFRVCFLDSDQGAAMAHFAARNLKLKKIGILYDEKHEYSKTLKKYFQQQFKKLGGEVTGVGSFKTGDKNYKRVLEKLLKKEPEALYIPGYSFEVAMIARQARRLGFEGQFLGGDGMENPQLAKLGGEAVVGSYFTYHFAAESKDPATRQFVKDYIERFKDSPPGLAALTYDAGRVLFHAMKQLQGSVDKPSLRRSLANVSHFPGATGKITINAKRNAIKPVVIFRVGEQMSRFVTKVDVQ